MAVADPPRASWVDYLQSVMEENTTDSEPPSPQSKRRRPGQESEPETHPMPKPPQVMCTGQGAVSSVAALATSQTMVSAHPPDLTNADVHTLAGVPKASSAADEKGSMTTPQRLTHRIADDDKEQSVVGDWLVPLRKVLAPLIAVLGKQRRPLVLDTLLSGTETEVYALSQSGLFRFVHRVSVEQWPVCHAFVAAQGQPMPECLHRDMKAYASSEAAQWCVTHGQSHEKPSQLADILCAALVCTPYSSQRSGRFRAGSVESHEAFDIAGCVLEHIRQARPRSVLIENVVGWAMTSREERDGGATSSMEEFMQALQGLRYHVRSIALDTDAWSLVRRPRIYLIAIHMGLASSATAIERTIKLVSAVVAERAKTPAASVTQWVSVSDDSELARFVDDEDHLAACSARCHASRRAVSGRQALHRMTRPAGERAVASVSEGRRGQV